MGLQNEIANVQNRAARFVTSNNYCFETGSMTGILEKLRLESEKQWTNFSVQRSKRCCKHSNR